MSKKSHSTVDRRNFFKLLATGTVGAAVTPSAFAGQLRMADQQPEKPDTNIDDLKKYPRNENSMPGAYPASVVQVNHKGSVVDNQPVYQAAYDMIKKGMLELTGKRNLKKAWRVFVKPGETIGLKVNPVAGKLLTTSHEVVKAVIAQLEEAGIKRENLVIWDRREFQLDETGFTEENYPGIKITGTEQKDKEGSYYDADGKLYGESMIDKDWYYWADVEGEYDDYTMPFMVNGGKYSYFSKICTQQVDKIINIPILKNAGSTVTLALKNLAFGAISNTSRLHKQLWFETCAQVCAFPPLRDKVVLNIADGLRGCFNGGPSANPQFITNYKTILVGSDPVAVDRVGYEIVLKKRIEEGLLEKENPRSRTFMDMAAEMELGESNLEKISWKKFNLG